MNDPLNMDEFERALTHAMRRVPAPPSLAEGVLARLPQQPATAPPAKVLAWPRPRPWLTGAIAAALLVASIAGLDAEHRRRQREQDAQRQFAEAMRVTDRALEHTRAELSRRGLRLAD